MPMTPDDGEVRVGATIRLIRERAGITRTALARSVGVTYGHIANVEEGRKPCSTDLLDRIAEELGTTANMLKGHS